MAGPGRSQDHRGNQVLKRTSMPRLTLRAKLLATGAILLAFTAAISALSISTISGTVERGTAIYDDGVVPIRNLGEAHRAFAHLNREVVTFLIAGTPISAKDVTATEAEASAVDAMILSYEGAEGVISDEEKAAEDAYRADFDAFSTNLRGVLELSSSGTFTEAAAIYASDYRPSFETVDGTFAKLVELADKGALARDVTLDE